MIKLTLLYFLLFGSYLGIFITGQETSDLKSISLEEQSHDFAQDSVLLDDYKYLTSN